MSCIWQVQGSARWQSVTRLFWPLSNKSPRRGPLRGPKNKSCRSPCIFQSPSVTQTKQRTLRQIRSKPCGVRFVEAPVSNPANAEHSLEASTLGCLNQRRRPVQGINRTKMFHKGKEGGRQRRHQIISAHTLVLTMR